MSEVFLNERSDMSLQKHEGSDLVYLSAGKISSLEGPDSVPQAPDHNRGGRMETGAAISCYTIDYVSLEGLGSCILGNRCISRL